MKTGTLRIAAVAIVAALVGGGTVAWADHQWSDVPSGTFFHEPVGAITDAGLLTATPTAPSDLTPMPVAASSPTGCTTAGAVSRTTKAAPASPLAAERAESSPRRP